MSDRTDSKILALLDLILRNQDQQHNKLKEILRRMSQLDDDIAALQQTVTDENTVIDSAIALISGIPQLITDAVNQALAAGATPEELQALTDLSVNIAAKKQALADAVAANTPPPPPP